MSAAGGPAAGAARLELVAAGRKGWWPAFRDATLFKVAYGFGLRRNEARMLDVADFGANPQGAGFGEYGVCYVRFGKASKGSPPKRRSVLAVWPWAAEVLQQWGEDIRPLRALEANPAMWPSERGQRIGLQAIDARFAAYRDALGLASGLDFHSLRRSYVTHLIEAGWDALFVPLCVSSDFRTCTLRRVLDQTIDAALHAGGRT